MPEKNTHHLEVVSLPAALAEAEIPLHFHHYGKVDSGVKVYLQAALHADEIPGLLVLRKLLAMLDDADAAGDIAGSITVAPFANPLGLNQFQMGNLQGRYYAENGKNFNRDYPDISSAIASRVASDIGDDAVRNTAIIRATSRDVMAEMQPKTALDTLRHALLSRSIDADYVFDLHCDYDASLYMFTLPVLWPQLRDLAAYLGCSAVLLAEAEPSRPFDESNSALWQQLAQRFPGHPIEMACAATTLELRSRTDVDESLAEQDARAIFSFLLSRGIVNGETPAVPEPNCEATPMAGVGQVIAPHAGVISYCKKAGEAVVAGELVATLFALDKNQPPTLLFAPTAGVLYARQPERYTFPGRLLCEIAGREPLEENAGKEMLSD